MRRLKHLVWIAWIVVLLGLSQAMAADPESESQPVAPAYSAIDPLAESSNEFLDLNLRVISEKARDFYQAGDYRQAAQVLLYVLNHDIGNAELIYSLACCYGRLDEPYLASLCLERAARAGFEDLALLAQEPAFAQIQDDALFQYTVGLVRDKVLATRATPGELIQVKAEALFPCRVQLPPDYDPNRSYPLLIGLHGYGSCADWFMRIWVGFVDPQFIYVTPQAPYPVLTEGDVRYGWVTGDKGSDTLHDSQNLAEEYVIGLIKMMQEQYHVNSVFLLGFSQGGILAYDIGIRHPDEINGLICFSAYLDLDGIESALGAAAGRLPVFVAHGVDDQQVPFAKALEAREVLSTAGFDVTFYEYAGGHGLSVDVLRAAEAWIAEKATSAPSNPLETAASPAEV